MINHARTLILNLRALGTATPVADYEEFIDPTFQPRLYTATLAAVRSALVPAGIDRANANLRANWLMQFLHAPDLEQYTLGIDPRVTYLVDDRQAAVALITSVPATSQSAVDLFNQLTSRVGSDIFSTRNQYAEELAALERIWLTGRDLGIRSGAAALAFVYRASMQP